MPNVRVIVAVPDEIAKDIQLLISLHDFVDWWDTVHTEMELLTKLRTALSVVPQSPDDPLVVIAASHGELEAGQAWERVLQEFPELIVYDIHELLDPSALHDRKPEVMKILSSISAELAEHPVIWRYRQSIEQQPLPHELTGLLEDLQKVAQGLPPAAQIVPVSSKELDL